MKTILLTLALCLTLGAQEYAPQTRTIIKGTYTVATLPKAPPVGTLEPGSLALVVDGTAGALCTTGGGTLTSWCRWAGGVWTPANGADSSASAAWTSNGTTTSTTQNVGVSGTVSVGSGVSTGVVTALNSALTGTPIQASVNSALMFQCNQYGCSVGNEANSNTDDFFHISRTINGSTGVLIYNRSDGALADAFLDLFAGTTGAAFRMAAQSVALGGQVNLVAQYNTGLNISNLTTTSPINFNLGSVMMGQMTGTNGFWEFGPVAGVNSDYLMEVRNPHAGASARSLFRVSSDSAYFQINSNSTAGGAFATMYCGGCTGGMNFMNGANSFMDFYTNGSRKVSMPADGGLQLATVSRPSCDAAHRGTLWYVAGGTSVADTVSVCTKDGSDAYGWRVIY